MDWLLFFSALSSATLLPGGSEALLIYRLSEGVNPYLLVGIATLGNVLGSLITYGMGRLGSVVLQRKWLRISENQVHQAETWFGKYGKPSLLLAWLPIVGDALCLVAGILRCPLPIFILFVCIGKLIRYVFIAWIYFL